MAIPLATKACDKNEKKKKSQTSIYWKHWNKNQKPAKYHTEMTTGISIQALYSVLLKNDRMN